MAARSMVRMPWQECQTAVVRQEGQEERQVGHHRADRQRPGIPAGESSEISGSTAATWLGVNGTAHSWLIWEKGEELTEFCVERT